ncbi:hypothetical protein [Kribbella monticola]|uniref:hypothetical protein n=1 Tax=Kribbella monticola TaxID=2185285 RepID=UPI000DD2CA53|nr:hypothetical protein [Kribbella monticola]
MRLWGLLGSAGLLLSLAGCGVPAGGAIGVSVDGHGRPVIYIQMCEGHIDGATLYRSDDDSSEDQIFGRWVVSPAVEGFSQFNLAAPTGDWRAARQLLPRDPATEYTIYGWSTDNSYSAMHLDFSQNSLAELKSGELRYPDFATGNLKTGSLQDFRKETCEQSWG